MNDPALYEAAFEDALRTHRWAYVRVDEQRRAIFAGAKVKSFDFLVHRPEGGGWLVDVKGRKFPYDLACGKHYWENWVTDDDLGGLRSWEGVFGPTFEAVFVFAYWITLPLAGRATLGAVHTFRQREYAFVAVPARLYAENARRRSDRWRTASMPVGLFKRHAMPVFGQTPALPAAG